MTNKLFRSRILFYHVAGWIVCWLAMSFEDYAYYRHLSRCLESNFVNILFFIPVIYLNIFVLIPSLLQQKRVGRYLFSSIAIIMLVCVTLNHIHFTSSSATYYRTWGAFFAIATELVALFSFTTVIKFVQSYYKAQASLRDVKTQNLEMELGLLKSQVNPHFLFNTLNNLYFLIKRSPDHAQEVVVKLSNHLSHQLYDNAKDLVEVKKEVENLANYIELERLRSGENATILFKFPEDLNGEKIAPMLLLPLLENAFKHGNTSATEPCFINCSLSVERRVLHFHCENTFRPLQITKARNGIGLNNVKRRLALLYPQKHQMDITVNESMFKLQLQITLDEN